MIHADPLRTTELVALIEEASAPLRHDVRNRIASVRNLAFFVRRKLGTENNTERDPRVNEFLLKIEGEVQRTDEVIDAWSVKVQAVCPHATSPVRLVDSVRLAIDCTRLPPDITLTLEEGDEGAQIDGDLQGLAFAARCLIENSGEALGSGSVHIRTVREKDDCRIVVVDHGPGIADRARALERFETTKPGHLGLGLNMARRLSTRYGGDLVIGSPERGAEVSLRIPIAGTHSPQGEGQ
jgi:signal transduction histidine kinase